MLIPREYNSSSFLVNNYSSLTVHACGFMFGDMRYGERLQKARAAAGLTQKQLADRINNVCTQENISKLERGTATGSEFTAQFAYACGVNAMWLAEEEGEMVSGTYTTSDPALVEILRVLEPRATYIKESALQNVLNTCRLADRATGSPPLRPLGHRLPPRGGEPHDRASDWLIGGPEPGNKKKTEGEA